MDRNPGKKPVDLQKRLHVSERRRKEIAKLSQKKYRTRFGQLVLEGVRSLESAIAAGAPLIEIIVSEHVQSEPSMRRLLNHAPVPVYIVPEHEIAYMSDVETSQGILAVAQTPLTSESSLKEQSTILVLDGLQDPGNVGTLLRTAAWFGVDAVVSRTGTVDFFNPKTIRASMGAIWDVSLVLTDDLPRLLGELRTANFTIYAADLAGTDVRQWKPRLPSVMILGSEAHGISPEVLEQIDETIFIPGRSRHGGTESLNVAIAGGILVYSWFGSQ